MVSNDVGKLAKTQLISRPSVDFVLDFGPDIPKNFVTDEQRLKQILINLIRNSIKFTSKGLIKLGVRVVKDTQPRTLMLEVYDTGVGIPKNKIGQLFTVFGKLEDNTNINKEGTGLGLYITSTILKQLGGTITVDSEEGKFT